MLVPHRAVWFLAGVSDEVIIRVAAHEDVSGILLIYNAAVREPAAAYEDVPHTLAQREEWFAYFTDRNYPILVAETDGVIVGWGSLGPHQERMQNIRNVFFLAHKVFKLHSCPPIIPE